MAARTRPEGDQLQDGAAPSDRPAADPVAASLEALAADTAAALAPPAAPGEGVTDLDASEREAGAAPLFDPTMAAGNAGALMAAVGVLRETLVHMGKLETPRVTLADDTVAPAAEAIGKVLARHGINVQEFTKGYELEIAAAMITWPIGAAAYAGVRDELAERRKAKPIEATADGAATAAPPAAADRQVFAANDPRSVTLDRK